MIIETSFVLVGKEIPLYRSILEDWLATINDQLAGNEENDSVTPKLRHDQAMVEKLISDTHKNANASGNANQIEVTISPELFQPFWGLMDSEINRLSMIKTSELDLHRSERNKSISLNLIILQEMSIQMRTSRKITSMYR